MMDLVLLAIVGAAAHFLLYRALVTRWLWSRYPAWIDSFFSCSACTGFWLGLGVGIYWHLHARPSFTLPAGDPVVPIVAAASTMVLSPMVAWLQTWSLERLGYSVPENGEEEQ